MAAVEPSGESVRPQVPAKRVSPVKRQSPHFRVTEPPLWPGVERTYTVKAPMDDGAPSS